MKKITNWIVGTVCALAIVLSTSTFAADTVATVNTPAVSAPATSLSLFNAGELGLSLGSGYSLDTSAAFQQPYAFNLNAGAFWFPWRNVGLEANVPFYSTKGVSVSEVQAGLLFRLPLAKETSILKNISPYVGIGAVYNWNSEDTLAYVAKAGIEFRLNKKWGVFVEDQYRNNSFTDWNKGQNTLNGGLKIVF